MKRGRPHLQHLASREMFTAPHSQFQVPFMLKDWHSVHFPLVSSGFASAIVINLGPQGR